MQYQKRKNSFFEMIGFSLVVCRNKEGKYLGVKETKNRGWWLPGGKVDPPETFFQAALREVKEEAGIDVELKGILRVEYYIEEIDCQRIKLIFYAEPKDEDQVPKNFADNESEEARWLTLNQIKELEGEDPGWRGPELHDWAKYLEDGGKVFPLGLLSEEGSEVKLL